MSQLTPKAEATVLCFLVTSIVVLAFVYFSIQSITGFQALAIVFVWIAVFVAIVIVRTAHHV
jgi:amino acid transporter